MCNHPARLGKAPSWAQRKPYFLAFVFELRRLLQLFYVLEVRMKAMGRPSQCRILSAVLGLTAAAAFGFVIWFAAFRKTDTSSPSACDSATDIDEGKLPASSSADDDAKPVGSSDGVAPLKRDRTAIKEDVAGDAGATAGWKDSYSVGSRCYCDTTFDHGIGTVEVKTERGLLTVKEICKLIGPGPGPKGRPLYNDIQCGNGPANDAPDEARCPGRVEYGKEGCKHIGPKWNFDTE